MNFAPIFDPFLVRFSSGHDFCRWILNGAKRHDPRWPHVISGRLADSSKVSLIAAPCHFCRIISALWHFTTSSSRPLQIPGQHLYSVRAGDRRGHWHCLQHNSTRDTVQKKIKNKNVMKQSDCYDLFPINVLFLLYCTINCNFYFLIFFSIPCWTSDLRFHQSRFFFFLNDLFLLRWWEGWVQEPGFSSTWPWNLRFP